MTYQYSVQCRRCGRRFGKRPDRCPRCGSTHFTQHTYHVSEDGRIRRDD